MLYIAYLDEFGHVGPYISRADPRHKTSPIFGIAGFVLPHTVAREFSGWFYRLRNQLLDFEIKQSGTHPSRWEKKGSALLTSVNVERYPELTRAVKRILSKIRTMGGFVIYVGFEKERGLGDSQRLYGGVLRRVLLRLDRFCRTNDAQFLVILDDNDEVFSRDIVLRKAQQVMFGDDACVRLIETPLQVESLIYPNVQCADWICGLLGRYGAGTLAPAEFPEFAWAKDRFEADIRRASSYSSILSIEQRIAFVKLEVAKSANVGGGSRLAIPTEFAEAHFVAKIRQDESGRDL